MRPMVRKASPPVYDRAPESRINAGFPQVVGMPLKGAEKLGPNRNRRQKQADRRQSGRFFHQRTEHNCLLERTKIEHSSLFVPKSRASYSGRAAPNKLDPDRILQTTVRASR